MSAEQYEALSEEEQHRLWDEYVKGCKAQRFHGRLTVKPLNSRFHLEKHGKNDRTPHPTTCRISLLTTSSAETVVRWFAPLVHAVGGSIELETWPPEVYITLPEGVSYDELLAGWQYDLIESVERIEAA